MRLIWIEFEVISTNLMGYIAENVGNKWRISTKDYKVSVISIFQKEINVVNGLKIATVEDIIYWSNSRALNYSCING